MTMRPWLERNLDHGGAGGNPQCAKGTGASFSQPGLEGADGGRRSSGEDSGEGAGPSTCLISLQSAGDAGDFAFLFFLDLVILEMTGVLVICTTGAVAGASCCCCCC